MALLFIERTLQHIDDKGVRDVRFFIKKELPEKYLDYQSIYDIIHIWFDIQTI